MSTSCLPIVLGTSEQTATVPRPSQQKTVNPLLAVASIMLVECKAVLAGNILNDCVVFCGGSKATSCRLYCEFAEGITVADGTSGCRVGILVDVASIWLVQSDAS